MLVGGAVWFFGSFLLSADWLMADAGTERANASKLLPSAAYLLPLLGTLLLLGSTFGARAGPWLRGGAAVVAILWLCAVLALRQ